MEIKSTLETIWSPSATLETIKIRAKLLASIREFFKLRNVLEVNTPILAPATVTDPYIESLQLHSSPTGTLEGPWYLQTSPEFAMKRLLAAGSGDIYQIAPAFRCGEVGRHHNPEFTMLEWYRLGLDHHALIDEVADLLSVLGISTTFDKISYAQVFQDFAGIEPHDSSLQTLRQCACDLNVGQNLLAHLTERDQWLDLLMSEVVGPKLGLEKPVFIYDFPATQAALAKIGSHGLAERFELFVDGIELANGYHELTDPCELACRFKSDNEMRNKLGSNEVVTDVRLLAAMRSGLPQCAGVAIGFDRLLMFKAGLSAIDSAMAFNVARI